MQNTLCKHPTKVENTCEKSHKLKKVENTCKKSFKVTKVEHICEKSHKVTKVENTLCNQSCKLSTRIENTLVLRVTTQPSVHVHTVLFYYLSTSWSKPLLVVKMTFVVATKVIVIILIDYKFSIGRKTIRSQSEEISIQH